MNTSRIKRFFARFTLRVLVLALLVALVIDALNTFSLPKQIDEALFIAAVAALAVNLLCLRTLRPSGSQS